MNLGQAGNIVNSVPEPYTLDSCNTFDSTMKHGTVMLLPFAASCGMLLDLLR